MAAFRGCAGIVITILTADLLVAEPAGVAGPDPAADLVRLRLNITTTASAADLAVEAGAIANSATFVLAGSTRVRLAVSGNRLRLLRNTAGESAEGQFQLLVAGVTADRVVRWTLALDPPGDAEVEVYNLNHEDHPLLVDRFQSSSARESFVTDAHFLRLGGPLDVRRAGRPLVLAHFYPWYTDDTWSSPEMLDRPLQPYSTDELADVQRTLGQAKSAGVDGVIVSWQGKETGDGWNDRRLRLVLEAARRLGLKVSTYLETLVANPEHIEGPVPTDPQTVLRWLSDLASLHGSHPAYLRVGDRPVIFVYAASRLQPALWFEIVRQLRASGQNPLLVGESTELAWLDPFEGQYRYANIDLNEAEATAFDRLQSLRVRTYHLLRSTNGPRRIWAATVSPGFDDTLLSARATHLVTDRAGGSFYNSQWKAALASNPDWILITSWNEWWENTHIEPGRRHGDAYLKATLGWASLFHRLW